MKNTSALFVSPGASLRDVLICINKTTRGIALVVDAERRLLGVITDGDVRRAILGGVALTVTAEALLVDKNGKALPVTARAGTSHEELVELVRSTHVSHIPVLDDGGRVVGLVGLDDLLEGETPPLQAVVMAGGYGTRMRPLTGHLPKPMLPVGEHLLMERILAQLKEAGIHQVHVTTHYLADKITSHFGNGDRYGVELKYVPEERLLGTAGGLSLIPTPDTPLLVINGDILTRVDLRAMLAFHKEHRAELTLAVREYEIQVPFGVVDTEGPYTRRIVEKPAHKFLINAGIYLLEPEAHRQIPRGKRLDMTELIELLLNMGRTVVSFPVWEYWCDIGAPFDYEKAQNDVKDWMK